MTSDADTLLERGAQALEEGDLDGAAAILERAARAHPDDPDIRHLLAQLYEEAGDFEAMTRELLQVRLLDAQLDREIGLGSDADMSFIEEVAVEVMASLPEPFRTRVSHVPVILEKRPSLALVHEGFDPRALGLFEGADILDGEPGAPAQVVLFTHNLLAGCANREELARQIEITILHEVGHFFGLDEDDMERLGLD